MTQDQLDLLHRYLDRTIGEEDFDRLQTLLRESAEARGMLRDLSTVNAKLEQLAAANPEMPGVSPSAPRGVARAGWLQWRPLAAAAAGLVLGLFSASMVFAYVSPFAEKAAVLLQESFESGPPPRVTGVPTEPGGWSGDYSEVVGEQQGVKPASGRRMLRFVRGDYEGRAIPQSHSSDVFRLVDVRRYRQEFADGRALVQLTALFNAAPFSEEETYYCTLTIFALDAGLVGEALRADNVLSSESLAYSRSSKVVLDHDPATWQPVSNELRLPPNTEYLMIRMGMSNDTKPASRRKADFAGHYADKVQLVLAHRREIAAP